MVHRREVEGQPAIFGNQGDLFLNAMTWFDHETGSVWSQPTGEAILGPLTGTQLELLPSSLTTWEAWSERFPDTRALDTMNVRSGFELTNLALVGVSGDEAVAVPMRDLIELGSVSAQIAGEPVLFVAEASAPRPAVYSRLVDGEERSLELRSGELVDTDTGQRWDPDTGASISGGPGLDRIGSLSSRRSDFANHFPDGVLLNLDR